MSENENQEFKTPDAVPPETTRPPEINLLPDQGDRARLMAQSNNGSSWFWWITALSLINSIAALSGGNWRFFAGLGITQVVDEIVKATELGTTGTAIAFIFDLLIAGLFFIFGLLARKRYHWAFILGMIVYALDALIFLIAQEFLSIAFHAFALFQIYKGFAASKKLSSLEQPNIASA